MSNTFTIEQILAVYTTGKTFPENCDMTMGVDILVNEIKRLRIELEQAPLMYQPGDPPGTLDMEPFNHFDLYTKHWPYAKDKTRTLCAPFDKAKKLKEYDFTTNFSKLSCPTCKSRLEKLLSKQVALVKEGPKE